MKHFASLNKTKPKRKHQNQRGSIILRLGRLQQGNVRLLSKSQTPDPSSGVFEGTCSSAPGQCWGLGQDMHPVPQTPVSNSSKIRQEGRSTSSSPHHHPTTPTTPPCKLVPGSAAQRVPFTFSAATNPSVSAVSICSQHPSLGCQWVQLGAASSLELNLSLGIIPHKLG